MPHLSVVDSLKPVKKQYKLFQTIFGQQTEHSDRLRLIKTASSLLARTSLGLFSIEQALMHTEGSGERNRAY